MEEMASRYRSRCKYTVQEVTASRKGVVLQLKLNNKEQTVTKPYSQPLSWADSLWAAVNTAMSLWVA
jgi:hypothetical protein